jgi:hypothetical protein
MDKILSIGKVIKMPCMRSGLCKYTDETVLVTKEFLEKLAPTMQGIPVVLDHPDIRITDQNIGTLPVVGRVADMHFDAENDVWLAHFVIDNAKAVELLQQGYGVSTAWIGTKYAGGGTFNNCPYDREAVEGRYEHLAIVQNPRYEMAVGPIFLNAKDRQNDNNKVIINNDIEKKGNNSMFGKVWKKITQREELMTNSNEEFVVEIDGVEKPLKDFIADFKANAKKNEEEKEESKYDVDGEKMTVNELISAYKNLKVKKNEDDEAEKKKKEDETKKNEEEEKEEEEKETKKNEEKEKDEKDEKVKKNARFNELDQIHENAGNKVDEIVFLSLKERTDLGKNRYGSKK